MKNTTKLFFPEASESEINALIAEAKVMNAKNLKVFKYVQDEFGTYV